MAVPPDGLSVPEVLKQEELALQRFQRLEVRLDLVLLSSAAWFPVVRADTARHEQERGAQRRFGKDSTAAPGCRRDRFHPRQCETDSRTT